MKIKTAVDWKRLGPPFRITLTRLGGRRMDADNLAGAFKHVQDQLCRLLAIDDGDERLTFIYAQEKSAKTAVEVFIEKMEGL